MKTLTKALLAGAAITAIGAAAWMLYKKNKKNTQEALQEEEKVLEHFGIDHGVLEADTMSKVAGDPDYGDVRRFADLDVPAQVTQLLSHSTVWSDDDLDWQSRLGDPLEGNGIPNSVHVLFDSTRTAGYPNNRVGFFIEVPPLYRTGAYGSLGYRDYMLYLQQVATEFWAEHRLKCASPGDVEIVGLHSYAGEVVLADGTTANRVCYEPIQPKFLADQSKFGSRVDGLYRYFTDVRRESVENDRDVLADENIGVHLFMGVWFKAECRETDTYGITLRQVLEFLEELVLKDNYVLEDVNHRNRQQLGPVIVHPGKDFDFYLGRDLKVETVLLD